MRRYSQSFKGSFGGVLRSTCTLISSVQSNHGPTRSWCDCTRKQDLCSPWSPFLPDPIFSTPLVLVFLTLLQSPFPTSRGLDSIQNGLSGRGSLSHQHEKAITFDATRNYCPVLPTSRRATDHSQAAHDVVSSRLHSNIINLARVFVCMQRCACLASTWISSNTSYNYCAMNSELAKFSIVASPRHVRTASIYN